MPTLPYGYYWRNYVRKRMLAKTGGRFEGPVQLDGIHPSARYVGGAICERCAWIEIVIEKRSRIQIAHLDGDRWNSDDDDNLAVLCIPCHKAHDFKQWAKRCRETRSIRKDKARPLLGVA